MNTANLSPDQMRLIARVLSLHFEEGRQQSHIATELGLSHAKVNRLIKQGRELGMVQITIKSSLIRLFELERAMIDRWKLKSCVVVPAVAGSPDKTLYEVGKGAGTLLLDSLRDGDTIAISGGKSLSALIANLNPARSFNINVVPMTGGVQGQHYTDVNHLATELSLKLGGQATLIHAPLHAANAEERDIIMSFASVREVMDKARGAAVALAGVGAVMGAESTYYQARKVSESERKKLYESGIRSEYLGHLIDMEGKPSKSEYNARLVALPPHEAAEIPVTIAIASGEEKVEPMLAALNGGYFNSVVTDENTARAMLDNVSTKD